MVVSLYYDMGDRNTAVQECGAAAARVRREIKLEILSGTPKMVIFEMNDANLWFGVSTGNFRLSFSESSGAPMSPAALIIDAIYWQIQGKTLPIQGKTLPEPLRVSVHRGVFYADGLTIQQGWFLGGSERVCNVVFTVKVHSIFKSKECIARMRDTFTCEKETFKLHV